MLNVLIFTLFVVGIGFIIFSVIKFKPVAEQGANDIAQETLDKLNKSITEADDAMEEISKLSQNIFDEMTEKYKELLYLYSTIDKKKQMAQSEVVTKQDIQMPRQTFVNSNFVNEPAVQPQVQAASVRPHEEQENSFMEMFNSENSKHREIRELYSKGLSISEIARQLNIGQSEVSLVIQLGKGGR